MAFKLDDFLSKKKEPAQVLDLSKVKINSKEDFRKYLEKVPEFKIKAEKVSVDGVKIRDKDFSFVSGKREEKQTNWLFPDPTPPDMRGVKLEDLCSVNIDWKMLTTLRPKTKVEEEMFSRLVQLGKLDLKYQQALKREKSTDWIRKTKNPRSSIVEIRVLSCKECGEDFCDGSLCSKMSYDNFFRVQASTSSATIKSLKLSDSGKSKKNSKKKRKRKSRRRKRSKARRMKPRKNSFFNRPHTSGCSRDHSRRGNHGKDMTDVRPSSLNRISFYRKPVFLSLKRSKSAPRLQCKRSDAIRSGYTSDSAQTQTDYSSQSDTESYPDQYNSPKRKKSAARVGFADGFLSDGDYTTGKTQRFRTHHSSSDTSREETQESDDSLANDSSPSQSQSPEKSPSRRFPRNPTTIEIKFDGFHTSSGVFFPRKSYAPSNFGSARHTAMITPVPMPKNQEVTRIVEGFARIDLSFADVVPSTSSAKSSREAVVSPKRISSRLSRSRTKTEKEPFPSSSYVKGQSLLGKFVSHKK